MAQAKEKEVKLTKAELIECGHLAAELTRQDILRACEEEGTTLQAFLGIINESLGATSVKQQYVPPTVVTVGRGEEKEQIIVDDGGWKEARPLVDHTSRLSAAKLLKDVLGLDAPKRMDATVSHRYLLPETEELVNKITAKNVTQIQTATSVLITQRRVVNFSQFDESPLIELGG